MSLISFTPVSDGTTAAAAGVNTPLSTIFNDYNGNITDANVAAGAAIAGSKISPASLPLAALVQTQSNGGTAGGTFSYINLGGIKMLWINSATNLTTTTSPTSYSFTLPTSFFSSITSVTAVASVPTTLANQFATISTISTSTIAVYLTSPSGVASCGIGLFVIGT